MIKAELQESISVFSISSVADKPLTFTLKQKRGKSAPEMPALTAGGGHRERIMKRLVEGRSKKQLPALDFSVVDKSLTFTLKQKRGKSATEMPALMAGRGHGERIMKRE